MAGNTTRTPIPTTGAPVTPVNVPTSAAANLAAASRAQKVADAVYTNTLYKKLKEEPKVRVSIAPSYRPWYGETMPVGLGGIWIHVPCDGQFRDVPKSFARLINERLRKVNDFLLKRDRMSQVQNNFERYAGELQF